MKAQLLHDVAFNRHAKWPNEMSQITDEETTLFPAVEYVAPLLLLPQALLVHQRTKIGI
jgi:hypothetical protein